MIRRVVQFSGGIGSWAATQRVLAKHGTQDLVLLFADTLVEDPDLYRFVRDAESQIGVPATRVADGHTPFEVFWQKRFLGNSRLAPCSEILKQRPCRRWLEENADPAETVLYVGIDWSEQRRTPAIERGWTPWTVTFPMCDPPYLTKEEMLDQARAAGLEPPLLYALGFGHNNCGSLCVRGGHRHWTRVLEVFPDRYAEAERQERELRDELGDVAILRDRSGGGSRPLTLTEFRERQEAMQGVRRRETSGSSQSSAAALESGRVAPQRSARSSPVR
ncbi:hypothetical protein [Streptomyces melanosporofaciens]|uniref:Phosphoadenosine phosphosulfate reductase family protein n=1 Tax=Streptomyces melanosporofaciens TaxID=67327 RepID=A0A1H4KP14_STRMJ|nr:hypothetical protein [Streptomyces melanosporofaciens]SEB60227.1 hypothetical protein SAMN04490356_0874 [Streptomyces melanosporofaciens]